MPTTSELTMALERLLGETAQQASWAVLVGPLPLASEHELVAAARRPGMPVLVVDADPRRLEQMEHELGPASEGPLSLNSSLLAAEAGEQCWYQYNDPRQNGTTPPEALLPRLPNLQLQSLDLRPALTLDTVLQRWREQRLEQEAGWPEGEGLLLLPAPEAAAVLAGAGPWLEKLSAVIVHGPAATEVPPELEAELAAACLQPETVGPALQLWRGSETLRLQKRLDHLQGERDQLVARNADLERRLELINGELDEILLLLGSAETAPPAAETSASPAAESAHPSDPPST